MKKILLLGGSAQQIVAIETAKRLGYYTILCDFLEDNPGQKYSDKFYLASTTDKDLILKIAEDEAIDGILAYASDPAAPTAAYVAEKMDLPGNPYESVEILCNKDKFRKFLKENGFNTPKAKGYDSIEEAYSDLKNNLFKLPVIVKPVDSSGSKGVSKISTKGEAKPGLETAMEFSRTHRIILEEFVDKFGYQIAGDGLSVDGRLVFRYFGNDHFEEKGCNPFVPIAASFPYNMPNWVHQKIHDEIQRLITLLKLRNAVYNFDIRIDSGYNVYLMEIAPRSGGNYIPQVIKYATDVDMVLCAIQMAMGVSPQIAYAEESKFFCSYYAIHSQKYGVLKEIIIDQNIINNHIIAQYIIAKNGDVVLPFDKSNSTLGVLIMRFDNMIQMLEMMDSANNWIQVVLE